MKHHMVLVLELLACVAVSSSVVVLAGQDELVFDTVYTSTRKVTCISVGEQSVWVGTEGGCLRWDPKVPAGAKYTAMDGLPANHVVGIAPGPDPQTVIIATAEGIKAFLDRRGKLTPVPDFSPQVGRASALASASGEVYVAVGRQVHVLQPLAVGFRWVPAGPELAAEARSLTHFEGVAWAGTGNGLFRLDAQRWEPVIHSEDPLAAQINALLPTNGDLCVGTVGGLFRMRAGRWRQFTTADGLPDNHVTALFADGDRIIVGTYGGGVAALRADAIEPIAGAPAYVTALDVCQISGAIWLGTEQEGTWLCERGNWSRQLARAEPPGHNITALAASEGEILVGTFEQGVGVLRDNAWRAFGTVHGLGSEWINHIAYGHNRVWARTQPETCSHTVPGRGARLPPVMAY